jgi:tRNA(fMet)-specific endonuclease VapC
MVITSLEISEISLTKIRLLFLDNQEIFDKASEVYADLKRKGELIQDADILIAATALTQELILVSDDSDFLRIEGVTVENWLQTTP